MAAALTMDSSTRPELPQPLRAPNVVSNQAMGRLCGLLTSDLEEPASASIPALLGRYRIIRPVAEGASGKVYEAEDLQLGRRVAMKVLAADADSMVKRFFREASVAAKLRHPNLITIHEVSMARRGDGTPVHFIVMDLHPRTLEAVLEKNELARDERLKLLEAVARAVHHAHENGVVHRDLKPANILIDERGHPIVSDFGLAREESQATLTRSGVPVGTPSYMSPEQVAGRTAIIGPRSDVYALGVILYRMLTNRLPFDGASVAEVYSSILATDPAPPEADRDLQTICLKALDRERDRRYATANDFAEDLRRFLAGEPILARPDRTIRRIRRLVRGPLVWVGAAGLLAASAVGVWSWRVSHREQAITARLQTSDQLRQIESAYAALQGRAEAMRYLEDSFHGGNDRTQAAAMIGRIEPLVRDIVATRPLTKLPQAWLGLARLFAGDDAGWRELDAAVDAAGDDPFPRILRARGHLAAYSREAQLRSTLHRDGARRVLELGALVETPLMRQELDLAAADIGRASASPLWSELPAAGDYRVYAEGASLLSRGDHQKAAARLDAIRDHAILGAEAECLRGICFALARDPAAAAASWERLSGRGWPMVLLAAARARLDAGRRDADSVAHYEQAARNAGAVKADGDLAKFALLTAGHAWQLIANRRKGTKEDAGDALARAGDALARAVALDENFGPAWCELADICASLGDHPAALKHARTSVRVEPRHGRAWQVLASMAQAAAKRSGYATPAGRELLAEAMDAASRAVDIEPDNPDFRFAAGHVCWQGARTGIDAEARLRAAIRHFDAAILARKSHGAAVGERAHAWLELGERQEERGVDPRESYQHAVAGYAEAMALGVEPELCRRYRGVAHRRLGEYLYESGGNGAPHLDQAEQDHSEAIRLDPGDAESHRLRAFVHRARAYAPGASPREHVRKGIEDLTIALRLNPDLVEAYADKAEAHAAINEFEDALACVEAGLARFPGNDTLANLRRRLKDFIKARAGDK